MANTANINAVRAALMKHGFTNPFIIKAILATVGKESNFEPKNENLNYTTVKRLREVWPTVFKNMSDPQVQLYVRQPEKLANFMYGGKYGNTQPGDGWKFRGRGFNGITFRDNYRRYGSMIGKNIEANPDSANDINTAAELNAVYFKDNLSKSWVNEKYGNAGINDWKDQETALRAAVNVNAGPKASDYTVGWNLEAAKEYWPIIANAWGTLTTGSKKKST